MAEQNIINSTSGAMVEVDDRGNVNLKPTGVGAVKYYDSTGTVQTLGAPIDATYVTLTANSTLSAEAVLGTAVIMAGAVGSRPAAATAGLLYFATDTLILYRDSGSAWVQVASTAQPTIRVSKAADEARTSNASLTADTNLLFAVAANEKWQATFFIQYESAANADFQFDFTIPSGTASYTVTGLDASDVVEVVSGANTTVTTLGGAGVATERDVAITVRVSNGATPGNVVFRWAQASSQSTATTVMAGSYLVANKLA